VLKVLRETYLGKVKMIYIDPPYNTGNDFVYNDDFTSSYEEFAESCKVRDEEGNLTFDPNVNGESNGRFHTDWLNMIYPRLKIARDFLTNDGLIFISIDDCEIENLRKICDEIFGVQNRIGIILWKKKTNGNNMGFIPPVHDYILAYAKSASDVKDLGYPITEEHISKNYSNPDNDPRGPWTTMDLSANHVGPYFAITNPVNGDVFYPSEGRYWVFNEKEVQRRIKDGRIIFGKSGNSRPVQKVFASERLLGRIRAESWWDKQGMNEDATEEIRELFGVGKLFTHPKPSKLIYNIVKIATAKDSIVMDFFSGSASTAHSIFKMNAEDEGNRKFILVQLPEITGENSVARKAGYNTICEIGKERIRRAGRKIKEEAGLQGQDLDIGFRVLKLAESNMEDVFYTPDKLDANNLFTLADNVKQDRTAEDLLFQVMLELGVELSSPIEKKSINGVEVFNVKDCFLIGTFDKNVNESTITEIAKSEPVYFVMRDASAANDNVLDNFDQLFRHYSPDTIRRIL
jgi:adenine-specific DNA-methyltransferase